MTGERRPIASTTRSAPSTPSSVLTPVTRGTSPSGRGHQADGLGSPAQRHAWVILRGAGVDVLDHRSAAGDAAELVVIGSRVTIGDRRRKVSDQVDPRPAGVDQPGEDVGQLRFEDLSITRQGEVRLAELRDPGALPMRPGLVHRSGHLATVSVEDGHLVTVARQQHRRRQTDHASTTHDDIGHHAPRGHDPHYAPHPSAVTAVADRVVAAHRRLFGRTGVRCRRAAGTSLCGTGAVRAARISRRTCSPVQRRSGRSPPRSTSSAVGPTPTCLACRAPHCPHISTSRSWRKRGVVSAVICARLRQLSDLGDEQAILGVDTQNSNGACKLYESLASPCDRERRALVGFSLRGRRTRRGTVDARGDAAKIGVWWSAC